MGEGIHASSSRCKEEIVNSKQCKCNTAQCSLLSPTHPQVVQSGIGDALAGDVFGELVERGVVRGVHGLARDELAVRAHRHVPRLDAHQVVERELQDETALCAHLRSDSKSVVNLYNMALINHQILVLEICYVISKLLKTFTFIEAYMLF